MPRNVDPSIIQALQQPNLQMAVFVTMTFATGTVNIWSGQGNVTWQNTVWTGAGSLLGIDGFEEGTTVMARGITLTLSGLDPALLADAVNDFQLGLPVAVYLGFYVNGALNANALTSWAGRMDQPTITVSGTEAHIAINCENRLLDVNVPSDRRYTLQDQQMTWPGDLGFQFVQAIQEINIAWGQSVTNTPNI